MHQRRLLAGGRVKARLLARLLVAAVTASATLTACTSAETDSQISASPALASETSGIVAEAKANGADAVQLAALADGEVTFAEYQQAVYATMECMTDAGIEVFDREVDDTGPYPMIHYSYAVVAPGLTEDQTLDISDVCLATHSFYVEMLYQTGDAAQEAIDARFEEVKDRFIACLKDAGIAVKADETNDELRQDGIGLLFSSPRTDCFTETGAQ